MRIADHVSDHDVAARKLGVHTNRGVLVDETVALSDCDWLLAGLHWWQQHGSWLVLCP